MIELGGYETLLSALATPIVAFLTYLWWRSSEAARYRKEVKERRPPASPTGGQRLPSPMRVLPDWMGFVGGHTLLIDGEQMGSQLEGWAREFGGDYELRVFGVRMVVVTGLADIRRIKALRPSRFRRDLSSGLMVWAAKQVGVTPSMFFNEGKEWGRSRRILAPSLAGHNASELLPIMAMIGERFCAKLGAHADAGDHVDATDTFGRYTHDVMGVGLFGIDVDSIGATQDSPSHSFDAMTSATKCVGELMTRPEKKMGWTTLSSWLPWVRAEKAHSKRLQKVIQDRIDTARLEDRAAENVGPGSSSASDDQGHASSPCTPKFGGLVMRKIVNMDTHAGKSDRMTFADDEIVSELRSLFIGGTETTALTLSWAMYYLAKSPAKFDRCRREADLVAGDGRGMVSQTEQMSQLKYASAVVKEVLRLRPPASFFFYTSNEGHTMKSGALLEKETSLCLLGRPGCLKDEHFTHASAFIPERWIDAERDEVLSAEGSTGDVRHAVEAWLPFGSGPRACPGQDVAHAEGALLLAAICARFDVSLAPGQPDPPQEVFRFVVQPKQLDLVFKRRTE